MPSAPAWTCASRPWPARESAGFNPRDTSEALRHGVQAFIRELWELDKPTVAAVNGTAVGPGAHLALACDFVLLCEQARFVWSFARWGLVVDAGGAYLLPRLVGLPRAKAMVMLGEGATGAEAVSLGLAYRCLPTADELAHEASDLAARLAAGPVRSLGLSKQLLNATFESSLSVSLGPRGPGPGHGGGLGRDGRGDGRLLGEAQSRLPSHPLTRARTSGDFPGGLPRPVAEHHTLQPER